MSDQPPGTPASSTANNAESAKNSVIGPAKGLAGQMGTAQGDAGISASGGASASLGTPSQAGPGPGTAAGAAKGINVLRGAVMDSRAEDLLDIRGELLAMMNKPGWQTSELWFLLAAAGAAQWAVHARLVNGNLTELLTYAAGLVYTYFRLTHKADVMGQVAADFASHAPGTVIDIEAEVAKVLPRLLAQNQGEAQ